MRRNKPTVAALMIGVALVALGFAALRSGSEVWYEIVYTLTVASLLFSTAAARWHPFWYGFAAIGWGYFLVGLGPWFVGPPNGLLLANQVNEALLTSRWLSVACSKLLGFPQRFPGRAPMGFMDRLNYTIGIGHCLITIAFALGGGRFASWAARRATRNNRRTDG